MKCTYNNPNLIEKHDEVNSAAAELKNENSFLKEVISVLLAFIVVFGIMGSATAIIFYASK